MLITLTWNWPQNPSNTSLLDRLGSLSPSNGSFLMPQRGVNTLSIKTTHYHPVLALAAKMVQLTMHWPRGNSFDHGRMGDKCNKIMCLIEIIDNIYIYWNYINLLRSWGKVIVMNPNTKRSFYCYSDYYLCGETETDKMCHGIGFIA